MARGERVLLCYGTAGASSARIEPAVEGVSPSPNRCLEAAPTQDTTYRLVAAGPGGEATAEVSVRVTAKRAGAAEASDAAGGVIIDTFVATAPEVAAGERLTLCYIATGADSLRLEPSEAPVTPGKGCVVVRPARTTTYTLTARAGGRTETKQVTVSVRQPGN